MHYSDYGLPDPEELVQQVVSQSKYLIQNDCDSCLLGTLATMHNKRYAEFEEVFPALTMKDIINLEAGFEGYGRDDDEFWYHDVIFYPERGVLVSIRVEPDSYSSLYQYGHEVARLADKNRILQER